MTIEDYLNEELLGQFIEERFNCPIIHDKSFFKYRYRPDYRLEEYKLIIEFDGYGHYTKAQSVLNDLNKDVIYSNHGYGIIRIPYFIQLSSKVIEHLFSKYIDNLEDFNVYPQGFIDKKAILPADFCELGLLRFKRDLEYFNYINKDIIDSLINKVHILGKEELVYPSSLQNIVKGINNEKQFM